jgi:hypothetical protein
MATFRNISDKVFADGNITVLPNQLWTVMDRARIEQLTTKYGWQFECLENGASEATQQALSSTGKAKSLTKMNRTELEAIAAQIGLGVTAELDTNRKLKDAIELRLSDVQDAGSKVEPA